MSGDPPYLKALKGELKRAQQQAQSTFASDDDEGATLAQQQLAEIVAQSNQVRVRGRASPSP